MRLSSAVVGLLGILVSASGTQAGALLADLSDRALKCAIDPAYYIDAKGATISTIVFTETGWNDLTVPLTGPALVAAETDRVEIEIPPATSADKPQRIAFVRTLEKPEPGSGSRKPRTVISLHVGDDQVGDECFVEKGRKPYVSSRFDSIRESVCGNDPAPTCEALLAKRCGPEPTPACTVEATPALEQASKAYIDKMNARAGKPAR
ncbi:hypothetical protein GCM10007301_48680 [Azorhizobium oxalatiphilum]|uniref:Uncharacterized protein n=1 Tax=Azorhizobium oxalatiphilum TaxID=980631 RepID=A0A917CDA6_9HYPH|nr:hypothetical protein [Azorhizobium oxalatiphilum]GGF82814.1 hypothetical protein GCM10007301_48680 [Azorhizobium oxalatiphilum]